jgi:beta-phosphoglucomutase-like phosphatase (HAD superfamily)
MPNQGFIFDLDSLVNVSETWTVAYQETLEAFGGTWTSELAGALRRRSIADASERIAAAAGVPDAEVLSVQPQLLSYFDQRVCAGELQVRPGALTLLWELGRIDVPFGVVSTTPRAQADRCVRATELRTRLANIRCGDYGTRDDPSPWLHDGAARRLGIRSCVSVAVVHDSNGLHAARAAAMFTLADPTVERPTYAHGDLERFWPLNVAMILKAAALPRPAPCRSWQLRHSVATASRPAIVRK